MSPWYFKEMLVYRWKASGYGSSRFQCLKEAPSHVQNRCTAEEVACSIIIIVFPCVNVVFVLLGNSLMKRSGPIADAVMILHVLVFCLTPWLTVTVATNMHKGTALHLRVSCLF